MINKNEVYFKLKGDTISRINLEDKYKDDGFVAKYCNKYIKFICKDISDKVNISYNYDEAKNYSITYALDFKNIKKKLIRYIKYEDIESPNIELTYTDSITCPNSEYIEEGYKAIDNVDGDITDKVVREIKNGKVYYTVTDSSGNKKVAIRKINYNDTTPPQIMLNGNKKIYLFLNTNYDEFGYNAFDNCDGDMNQQVTVESNLDNSKVGEYEIKYIATDSNGNKTSTSRQIIVYKDTSSIPKNGKTIYLTFDDGPGPYTNTILDILKKYNIKATFFVTNQFSSYNNIIKREFDEGHTVAIHTYTHNFKTVYTSVDSYLEDFNNMNQIVFNQTGMYSKIFRFPGGSSNTISKFNKGIVTEIAAKMTELGYIYFDWNVDSNDTASTDPNVIYNNVINGINNLNSSVVLMHDIKKANIESTEMIIQYALQNGYTFMAINENTQPVHHKINN